MIKYFLSVYVLLFFIFGHNCNTLCLDGLANNGCSTCTNGVCVCPSYSRHGFPCTTQSDVRFKEKFSSRADGQANKLYRIF